MNVVVMALCSVASEADDFVAIAAWARQNHSQKLLLYARSEYRKIGLCDFAQRADPCLNCVAGYDQRHGYPHS